MQEKYLQILWLSETATEEDIKKAYRKLSMQYHPDKWWNEYIFKQINEAYDYFKRKWFKINKTEENYNYNYQNNYEEDKSYNNYYEKNNSNYNYYKKNNNYNKEKYFDLNHPVSLYFLVYIDNIRLILKYHENKHSNTFCFPEQLKEALKNVKERDINLDKNFYDFLNAFPQEKSFLGLDEYFLKLEEYFLKVFSKESENINVQLLDWNYYNARDFITDYLTLIKEEYKEHRNKNWFNEILNYLLLWLVKKQEIWRLEFIIKAIITFFIIFIVSENKVGWDFPFIFVVWLLCMIFLLCSRRYYDLWYENPKTMTVFTIIFPYIGFILIFSKGKKAHSIDIYEDFFWNKYS